LPTDHGGATVAPPSHLEFYRKPENQVLDAPCRPAQSYSPFCAENRRIAIAQSAKSKDYHLAMDSMDIGKSEVQRSATGTSAQGDAAWKLPEAMTGRASPAKAAVGDKPVFAYIASLPQPQRGIAEAVDALAAKTLPDLQRSVKWGMAYYGVGDGWCFSSGGFASHVKLMFINGAALDPVPPVTPVGMGKSTRGLELESVNDIDERQIAAWMQQVASVPGVGGKKR
jgi:hypothetical protein